MRKYLVEMSDELADLLKRSGQMRVLSESIEHVKLLDIYDEWELDDENESLYHHITEPMLDFPFTVHTASPNEAAGFLTVIGEMTLIDAYKSHADAEQKRLVAAKKKKFERNRIVVLDGKRVIDGNHHVIAAILNNLPVRYIDLSEM